MKKSVRGLVVIALAVVVLGSVLIAAPTSSAQATSWSVVVFGNRDLAGAPVFTGVSPNVSYAWGAGPPVINGMATGAPTDNFSARFTTSAFFTTGNYRFTIQVDDGARLYVDGLLLINAWQAGQGLRTLQADYTFPSDGTHTIMVEMFDAVGDATIVATWALSSGPGQPGTTPIVSGIPWTAQFFSNTDLAGAPVFITNYGPSGLNLNWGTGSPGGSVPVDNFSARFTRTLTVPNDIPQGVYKFYAKADDSFRFYIDQTLVFDQWGGHQDQTFTADITLLPGPHDFRFEYREFTVNAYVFLTWTPPHAQNPVVNPDGGVGTPGVPGTPIPGQSPVPTGVTGTVNVGALNVRNAPDTTAPVITQIRRGEIYPVVGRTGDNAWTQITVAGQTGWVSSQFLTLNGDINRVPITGGTPPGAQPTNPPPATNVRGQVLGNLRLRSGPTTRSARIGIMPWGTVVPVLGKDRGHSWYKVDYNGLIGWAYAPWIQLVQGTFDELPYLDGTLPVNPTTPTEGVIIQAYGNVRLRSGPGVQFPQISLAPWGTRLQVLGRSPDARWYKVRYGDLEGWTFATWYRPLQGDIGSVPIVTQ